MDKMTGCACNADSRAGQGMSYQFSKLFSAGVTGGVKTRSQTARNKLRGRRVKLLPAQRNWNNRH